MIRPVIISRAADRDLETILSRSHEQFGAAARVRYEALLKQAMRDVSDDPNRAGSNHRPEIADDARTYHISHSQRRAQAAAGRVKRPRHVLLYRVRPDGAIEIGRVLHDSMDLERHLPVDFRN